MPQSSETSGIRQKTSRGQAGRSADLTCVVVHYGEIALKGSNRISFENRLLRNIKYKLGALCTGTRRESGLLVAELKPGFESGGITEILSRIPGIAHFSFAFVGCRDIEELAQQILVRLEAFEFTTFKIDCRRADKQYPLNSMEVNRRLGDVVRLATGKTVRLTHPDLTVKVEILRKRIYVSFGDHAGVGGMPTDPGQHVMVLLSGGFDSPVAAFLMMKRGCRVSLVHFQNRLQTGRGAETKVVRLAEQLSRYQTRTRLLIFPFEEIQKEIIMNVPAAMRMLVYRRFMLRLGAELARRRRARFLVVGDSLSQVASQTLTNLEATYSDQSMPVFTPLIGLDKKEIIDIAREIGTYDISALPYEDCCSYFVPRHPELRARASELNRLEGRFSVDELSEKGMKEIQVHRWE